MNFAFFWAHIKNIEIRDLMLPVLNHLDIFSIVGIQHIIPPRLGAQNFNF